MIARACLSLTIASLCLTATVVSQTPAPAAADRAAPRTDANSQLAHTQLLAKARQGRIDVYFAGDSITRRWGATDYPGLLANWRETFHGWNAANFGWGGDTTQNILWRLENGELDGVDPKVIVLLAGTNNVGTAIPAGDDTPRADAIAGGIRAIVQTLQAKAPRATIVLMAVLPRRDAPGAMSTIDKINSRLLAVADGRRVRLLNINHRLVDAQGRLRDDVSSDGLHLTLSGYQIWGEALTPILTELLGPRADVDTAPPPTGDPSALNRTQGDRGDTGR